MEKDVEKAVLDGNLDALERYDFLSPILPYLRKAGYCIKPDGKIYKPIHQLDPNDPWIHFNKRPSNTCRLYNDIINHHFGIVPSPCFECVKVAVYPITLKELMEVYRVFKKVCYPCKCGIDERGYGQLFGGYIYTDAIYKGVDILKEMRQLLGGIKIIVKQGCTEFGLVDNWKQDLELERMILDWFEVDNNVYHQPPYLKARIVRHWHEFAKKHNAEG
jgi:hypothetical protein